jgi:hypothetical protein
MFSFQKENSSALCTFLSKANSMLLTQKFSVMKRLTYTAMAITATAMLMSESATYAQRLPYSAYTCKSGFVWREAFPNDFVCVTPQIRSQTAADNAQASTRRSPNGGAYGPNTCKSGFVWREARPSDLVCVLPQAREQARSDNASAVFRMVAPDAAPSGNVDVTTSRHQSGGYLFAAGRGFSPSRTVRFYAIGSGWAGPYSLGAITSRSDGSFSRQFIHDARCRAGMGLVTVVAADSGNGRVVKAGTTSAFSCS